MCLLSECDLESSRGTCWGELPPRKEITGDKREEESVDKHVDFVHFSTLTFIFKVLKVYFVTMRSISGPVGHMKIGLPMRVDNKF